MILADSSVWIDYLTKRSTPQVQRLIGLRSSSSFAVGDLIVTEVLQGIRSDAEFLRVKNDFMRFPVLSMVNIEAAVRAAENYRHLRRMGITVRSAIDCLIATYCIDGGHQLLHSDHDFDPFEAHLGLSVVR